MKYFSTFTGVGGLDYGLEEQGFECVGFSEIKNSSIDIYKKHYPDHENYGDIIEMDFNKLSNFDILIGGFPCQSFSLAGLRKGFRDQKGKKGVMIFYLYDLMMTKKPDFVVLENVKGLLNHAKGKTYENVLRILLSAGYKVKVLLLNSIFYGSAQSRERLIFLCSKKKFNYGIPEIVDDGKRFRDVKESKKGEFKKIKRSEREIKKVEQKHVRNYELIGDYDRVGTLTTQFGCGEKAVAYDDWVRFLTPLECERLQGFPDNWTQVGHSQNKMSDSARYFAMGNAVSVDVSRYLFGKYLKNVWY